LRQFEHRSRFPSVGTIGMIARTGMIGTIGTVDARDRLTFLRDRRALAIVSAAAFAFVIYR
jgi:hypothetical protein